MAQLLLQFRLPEDGKRHVLQIIKIDHGHFALFAAERIMEQPHSLGQTPCGGAHDGHIGHSLRAVLRQQLL